MKYFSLIFAAIVLSGCVTADPAQIGPFPENYRSIVKQYVRDVYFDPYSIRDAALSSPQPGHLFFQQGWVTCFSANAKNRMGGYTGRKTHAILINSGQVVNAMENAPLCQSVFLEPWPEIESQ